MKTLEQIRAELIVLCGFKEVHTSPDSTCWVDKDDTALGEEPLSTLDSIAALMPEGWKWERFQLADGNMILEATRFSDGWKVNRLEGFDEKGVRLTVEDFTIFLHSVLTATNGGSDE